MTYGPHAEKTDKSPFNSARAVNYQTKTVWEKIECDSEEYVRVRVNEIPYPAKEQPWCPLDKGENVPGRLFERGLCPLKTVLKGMEWANGEGEWAKCSQNLTWTP